MQNLNKTSQQKRSLSALKSQLPTELNENSRRESIRDVARGVSKGRRNSEKVKWSYESPEKIIWSYVKCTVQIR